MKRHHLLLLSLTVVVVLLAWTVSQSKAPQTEVTRSELFPSLLDSINEIALVNVRNAQRNTELQRDGERWTVTNKDAFEADAAAVKRVALQLANARIVEPKTSSPNRFAKLGVADIGDENSAGTLVELLTADGNTLAALIVGHERDGSTGDQHYVRRRDEDQSWLVVGELDPNADPITWVDAQILDIDTQRVMSVLVEKSDAAPITLSKAEQSDNFFTLNNIPDGYEQKSKATVSALGALLLDLRFNDVLAAAKLAALTPVREVTVTTFNGLVVTLKDYLLDDQKLVTFSFAVNEELAAAVVSSAAATSADQEENKPEAADTNATEEKSADETPQAESERLRQRTARWAYVIPDYKRRMMEKTFEDLIKTVEPEKPDATQE
jgi:hypothetical protein